MRANQSDARMLSPGRKEDLRRRDVHAVIAPGWSPGSDGGEADQRAMSGSTQVAVRVVDAAGGVPIAGRAVRPARFGVDGGTLSAALGPDAAEARAARLRAEPRGSPALVETGIP